MLHGGLIAGDLMRWGGMAGWPGLEPGIPGLVRSGIGDSWAGQVWSWGFLGWSGLEPGIPTLVLRTAYLTLIQFTGTRIQATIQIG